MRYRSNDEFLKLQKEIDKAGKAVDKLTKHNSQMNQFVNRIKRERKNEKNY